ncbi:hypothetical protein [Rhizobium rhizosphaerae]|uniref:hypothetical protein n=1 Tax=Xaviernesmea rhizosphaerae TaxID=1672749 RepID=UPI001179BAA6|nr:hypothetical protein [Xaviernesmea rhizosphaerae]
MTQFDIMQLESADATMLGRTAILAQAVGMILKTHQSGADILETLLNAARELKASAPETVAAGNENFDDFADGAFAAATAIAEEFQS